MPRDEMMSLWNDFNLDQDQYSLLQTLATAFGLWYPEQGGYVIPTLMRHVAPESAIEKVAALKGMTAASGNEVQYHSLPANEYQIIMKFLFPHNMPKGYLISITSLFSYCYDSKRTTALTTEAY